jgi:hypothetical protein
MKLSSEDLLQSREATQVLLDQLGLSAYLFEVEPREVAWQVRVECAVDSGWQSTTLDVDKQELFKSRTDKDVFQKLLVEWRRHFAVGWPD